MKKRIWMIGILLLLAVFAGWVFWANTAVEVTQMTVVSDSLPENFSGLRIAHVSDLHNAELDEGNAKLLQLLQNAQPDIIAMTGDMIDSRNTDMEIALDFAREAVKIAPCYYSTGNHESRIDEYEAFEQGLMEAGVTVLRGEGVMLERNDQQIQILGVDDYMFYPGSNGDERVEAMLEQVKHAQSEGFNILLFHRPELAERMEGWGIELILSGHAHGGQVRIPFVGGLIAPDQGFFPEYTEGLHSFGQTQMVVSRGLGNSIIPIRINNRPEIILITLSRK